MQVPFHHPVKSDDGEPATRDSEFLSLLEGAYRDIYTYVFTLVGNRNDADDVIQDVCVTLWSKFDEFDPSRNFRKWAIGIAFNTAKAFVRRKRRHSGLGLSDECLTKIAFMQSTGAELFELRRELLDECLKKLSPQDRRFLMGYFTSGFDVIRYAESLKIPSSTAYSKLRRLREQLMGCVNRALGRNGEMF